MGSRHRQRNHRHVVPPAPLAPRQWVTIAHTTLELLPLLELLAGNREDGHVDPMQLFPVRWERMRAQMAIDLTKVVLHAVELAQQVGFDVVEV